MLGNYTILARMSIVSALKARLRPIISGDPDKYVGGILVNALGLQVWRAILLNGLHRLRPRPVAPAVKAWAGELERDGIVVIPDFLRASDLAELTACYAPLEASLAFHPDVSKGAQVPSDDASHAREHYATANKRNGGEAGARFFALLEERVSGDPRFRALALAALGREPRATPWELFVHKWWSDEYPELENASFYHADTFHPEYKGYLYLKDVSAENGAFIYAKGSQKMTMRRLVWEYLKSIAFAKSPNRRAGSYLTADGRSPHNLTEHDERFLRIVPTSMEGRAGTLLVFKTAGIHRRGDFSPGTARAVAAFAFS